MLGYYLNVKSLVRYADDFKIMCKTYKDAQRFCHATEKFLKERLGLEISPEKSKVTNLKKNSTDFLGFKVKVHRKGKSRHGYVACTDMSDKAKAKVTKNVRYNIIRIQRHTTVENIQRYNSAILGIQNYYKIATNVYNNLDRIGYSLLRTHYNRLRIIAKIVRFSETPAKFKEKTKGLTANKKIYQIKRINLLPLTGVHHTPPMNFSQTICDYTDVGRKKIHASQRAVEALKLSALQMHFKESDTVEQRSNAISRYVAQYGKCYITGEELEPQNAKVIKIDPNKRDGSDSYSNIVLIDRNFEQLIYEDVEILKLLNKQAIEHLNRLRKARNLKPIK